MTHTKYTPGTLLRIKVDRPAWGMYDKGGQYVGGFSYEAGQLFIVEDSLPHIHWNRVRCLKDGHIAHLGNLDEFFDLV